jgi:hypothetical protein
MPFAADVIAADTLFIFFQLPDITLMLMMPFLQLIAAMPFLSLRWRH